MGSNSKHSKPNESTNALSDALAAANLLTDEPANGSTQRLRDQRRRVLLTEGPSAVQRRDPTAVVQDAVPSWLLQRSYGRAGLDSPANFHFQLQGLPCQVIFTP